MKSLMEGKYTQILIYSTKIQIYEFITKSDYMYLTFIQMLLNYIQDLSQPYDALQFVHRVILESDPQQVIEKVNYRVRD